MAAVAAPAGSLAQGEKTTPARAPAEVRIGQNPDFSRIEFHFAGGARASHKKDGDKLILRFNRNVRPDISSLRVFPPKWLKTADSRIVNNSLEVTLTLAEGADYKVGQADGATFVNLFEGKQDPKAEAAAAPSRPSPVPDNGVVKMAASAMPGVVELNFPWKAPLGAAVFRRGEAVWIVFDARARLDLSAAPKVSPQMSRIGVVNGSDYVALRIASPAGVPVAARAEGGTWTVTLGQSNAPKPGGVAIGRDKESEVARLAAPLAGASRAIWITDGGDRFAAVPALAPSKGMEARRQFVDLTLLPTAQGLAIEPRAADLAVAVEGDLVRMGRPKGLALSSIASQPNVSSVANAPQPAAWPALIDFDNWPSLEGKSFYERMDEMQQAAADEAATDATTGKTNPQVQARMALARFLVGSELSFEAIGALNLLAQAHPQMLADPEFRGLRGAARAMSGRYEEAALDLNSPALIGDPSAALWRGYIATQQSQWEEARKAFSGGYMALNQVAPNWRARFARADAEAAVNLGQIQVARTQVAMAYAAKASPEEDLATSLVHARLWELEKDIPKALAIYDQLARTQEGRLAAAALLRSTELRYQSKQLTAAQSVEILDGVRYRWRGDATEIEATRALGKLYQSQGKYREALEVWRAAGRRQSDSPQYQALQNDLSEAFRFLFLEGGADGMEPIQSLALFWDFKDFTPIGAEGDFMVRRMARRLVDVDLLDQAAYLLDYQVNNRLDGVAKAQVATDLALIHLMNRKPEQALVAINSSRTTTLPSALNVERRNLTARALMALGRYDDALEMIEPDKGAEADEVRAEIAWRSRDWKAVGPTFEKRLGDRWRNKDPLSNEEEARLLRASIGYSLAQDDPALARLRDRFSGYIDAARAPEALRIALVGIDDARLTPSDFSRIVAEGDTFAGWVNKAKQRFREKPAPVQTAAAKPPAPIPPNAAPARPQPKTAPAPAQAAAQAKTAPEKTAAAPAPAPKAKAPEAKG